MNRTRCLQWLRTLFVYKPDFDKSTDILWDDINERVELRIWESSSSGYIVLYFTYKDLAKVI